MNKSALLFLFLALVACNEAPALHVTKGRSHVKFAEFFDIRINNRDTVLIIKNPDSSISEQFLLTRDSSKQKKDHRTLLVGKHRILAGSSTFIGMMSKLSMENEICGVLNKAYLANKQLIKGIESGEVIEVGSIENLPLEKVIENKIDLILYSGFGNPISNEEKLEKLGINCLPIYDWKEKDPLGEAEWILLYGFLSGKEDLAFHYLTELETNYNKLIRKTWKTQPTILAGNIYGDVWNTPTGESYVARMMKDAGGKYIFSNSTGTGSLLLSIEEVIVRSDSADIWINPGYHTKSELLNVNPKAAYIKAFKSNNVFCYSHDMNRFWEMSAIEPDKMLSDQIKIFHGGNLDSLYFYRRIVNDIQ